MLIITHSSDTFEGNEISDGQIGMTLLKGLCLIAPRDTDLERDFGGLSRIGNLNKIRRDYF